MDGEISYPNAKRPRTSRSPSSSRSHSRNPAQRSPHSRDRSYDRSQSRSRSRSASHRRRRLTPTDSSHSHTPHHSNSRDGSHYSPRPASPNTDRSPPTRTLHYLLLATLPRAHRRGITCAKFSPDGALLATASADATINIYSVPTSPTLPTNTPSSFNTQFKHIRTLRGHLSGVNALSWSPITTPTPTSTSTTNTTTATATQLPNHYTLASASDDKDILLWSPLSSDSPIAPSPLTGHSNYVYSLAFSPKGNMLVSGSYDEAVFLWDVRSGRCMRQLPAHSDPVGGVDFVCDGTMMVSCSTDGLIRIWDSGTGQCLRTLVDEDRNGVTNVMFVPNGRYVLAWTLDGCVRLWDYVGGRCVKTYQGHRNGEFSLGGCVGTWFAGAGDVEEEGAFVASGSEDGTVVVWDVTTKEVLWRGEGHRDVVLGVDCVRAKDGGRGLLVSVGKDRDVKVWIEDVEEEVLERRREVVDRRKKREDLDGGYAVDEDEDVDVQMQEMEDGGDDDQQPNGHAMEVDGVA